MLKAWFKKYLESRLRLTAYNGNDKKEARQHTHFVLFPPNSRFNITVNQIMDRPEWYKGVLHNHPWFNLSIILKGGYWEKSEKEVKWYGPGSIIFRTAKQYHCIWIKDGQEAWTLFFHGPAVKKGFDFMQDGQPTTPEELCLPRGVLTQK